MGGLLLVKVSLDLFFSFEISMVIVFTILVKISMFDAYFSLDLLEEGCDFILVSLDSFHSSSSIITPIAHKSFSMEINSENFNANVTFVALSTNWEMMVGKTIV